MRRRRSGHNGIGRLCIITGIMVLLAMILPGRFWWFLLGVSLISFGIWLNQCK